MGAWQEVQPCGEVLPLNLEPAVESGHSPNRLLSGPSPAPLFSSTDIYCRLQVLGLPLMAQLVKDLPALRETWVRSLGWEGPLEKEKATHSSILAWRIAGTVQSMGSQSRTRLSD